MTDKNEDHRYTTENAGNRLCAEIARAVYDHLGSKAAGTAAPLGEVPKL